MTDQPLHMLKYWLEDKGLTETAEVYFPGLFASDPVLKQAYQLYTTARFAIESRIKILVDQAEEEWDEGADG